ncbi:MAG: DUF2147 domain-containing protein [Paludibacteraceae bacterium]|nr:DUF2147 domain-containing protein [Paludibacteraceae bacterium]
MIQKSFLLGLLLLASVSVYAGKNDIVGYWLDDNKDGIVEFYATTDSTFEARLRWLKQPNDANGRPLLDRHNPDKSLRTRKVMGIVTMIVRWNKAEQCYELLKAYDPKFGLSGTGRIWVNGNDMTIKAGKFGIRVKRAMARVKGVPVQK